MKTIKQTHDIRASVEEVYLALTNPLTIELWSGFETDFKAEEGYEFSLWEGEICGRNIQLVKNEKIVQQWYFAPHKEESIVTLVLLPKGNRTIVELEHTNVPDEAYEDMKTGWKDYYWGAIKKYFK